MVSTSRRTAIKVLCAGSAMGLTAAQLARCEKLPGLS